MAQDESQSPPPPPAVSAGTGTEALSGDPPSGLEKILLSLTSRYKAVMYACIALAFLLWVAVIPVIYLSWMMGAWVWDWAESSVVRSAVALFASFFLFCLPVWTGMAAAGYGRVMARIAVSPEATRLLAASERVRETEEDAINRLESTDEAKLLPLLRYSRAQLDAYYTVGLAQTRRSFYSAVVAMWLGFAILIFGVALYVGPVERLGIDRPGADFSLVILASATIVEFISALFLWVYRSTIGQLTYYYRLQMRSHTAILCFRMAGTMGNADATKATIISSILDSSLVPERPPAPGSAGFGMLLRPAAG